MLRAIVERGCDLERGNWERLECGHELRHLMFSTTLGPLVKGRYRRPKRRRCSSCASLVELVDHATSGFGSQARVAR